MIQSQTTPSTTYMNYQNIMLRIYIFLSIHEINEFFLVMYIM